MAMSPVLLRPRRKQAAAPSGPVSPTEPIGVSLTTAPLAPTSVGLTSQPSNLVVQEVFAPDAPTGVTASPVANAPSAPTNVSLATVPSAPTSIGLTGQPGNVVLQEVFAPDAPTGVTLTPQSNTDPYFSDVTLLLQDSLADQSLQGQTIVASGNAAASTTQVKYGTHSLYFDGSGDWATIANTSMAFGTDPFTVEFWMYWDGTVTGTPWMGVMGAHTASSTGRYGIFMNSSGIAHYIQSSFPSAASISANTWHHIASTRDSSGVCRLFVDGVLKSTVTDAGNLVFPQGWRIGNDFSAGRPPFSGYLDDIRITKGVCRYTANFTPPTQAFPS